jgi:hypothetical protein
VLDDMCEHLSDLVERRLFCHAGSIAHTVLPTLRR